MRQSCPSSLPGGGLNTAAFIKGRSLAVSLFLCFVILALAGTALAGRTIKPPPSVLLNVGEKKAKPQWLVLPYAFSTESLEFTYGLAGGARGYIQDQAGIFAAVMNTANESRGVFLNGWNYKLPFTDRLFFDFNLATGNYTKQRVYAWGNRDFRGHPAGTNDSNKNNYLVGEGRDQWYFFTFRYVLPWGHGKLTPMPVYHLDKGILASEATGSEDISPVKSGVTTLELTPFYWMRSLESDRSGDYDTSGLTLALIHHNTDFPANPSMGDAVRVAVTHDFGLTEDSRPWTTLEAEVSAYLPLGSPKWARQQVLAFNIWTSYAPTWEKNTLNGDQISENRPVPQMSPKLGGFWRMRGFPTDRFNDRAALYYGAEYRMIPKWQPLNKKVWLGFIDIDWWQFVGFAELGRVADQWDLVELNSDLRWDVGVGLRMMIIKAVCRLDVAYSEEGVGVWAMVGHPF